jgi:hypothetical protein
MALTFSYLSIVPLGDSPKQVGGDPLGRLSLIEEDRPGSNLTYVRAPDCATLACLQHRLDELNTNVRIEI